MNHIVISDLERLRAGTANLSEVRVLGAHLRECAQCRETARALFEGDAQALSEALIGEEELFHPEDDLHDYVDDLLSAEQRATLEEHLDTCEGCRDEVDELRSFASSLQSPVRLVRSGPGRPRLIAWSAAAAAVVAGVVYLGVERPRVSRSRETASVPQRAARTLPTVPATQSSTKARPEPARSVRKPQWQGLVDEALRTKRLPLNEEVLAFAAEESYRGSTEGNRVPIRPAGTAIEEQRPRFEWPAVDGARYEVTVARADGKIVEQQSNLTLHHWRSSKPLRRGEVYQWQVRVVTEGGSVVLPRAPAPPAYIRVLGEREMEELREARRLHADDHLLLALLYARMGLMDETRRLLGLYSEGGNHTLGRSLIAQLPGG